MSVLVATITAMDPASERDRPMSRPLQSQALQQYILDMGEIFIFRIILIGIWIGANIRMLIHGHYSRLQVVPEQYKAVIVLIRVL